MWNLFTQFKMIPKNGGKTEKARTTAMPIYIYSIFDEESTRLVAKKYFVIRLPSLY